MSYVGNTVAVPLGKLGVRSDDPELQLSPGELIGATNVDLYRGVIETAPGSQRWNALAQLVYPGTATPNPIMNATEWYPSAGMQRVIAAGLDGQLYRFKNPVRYSAITPTGVGTPATLTMSNQPHFVNGGRQSATLPRKLFFFSGNDPIQVIEGDTLTRRNISGPALEWESGNYPTFGILFRNRLFTLGMPNNPHTVLASGTYSALANPTGQENFDATLAWVGEVYPGEGERLVTAWVFRGKLFVAKYPSGVYILRDEDTDSSNWYFSRVSSILGCISAHGSAEIVEDVLVSNQQGTVSSMAAAFQLGDVKFSDVFSELRCEEFIRKETDPFELDARWSVYYSDKKRAIFSYSSTDAALASGAGWARDLKPANRLVILDLNNKVQKVHLVTKDDVQSLFLLRDAQNRQQPAYGSTDGYIYLMDSVAQNVAGANYSSEFRLPQMNFGTDRQKNFDFLEIEAEHCGLWNVNCDVYLDGEFSETITFSLSNAPVLRATGDTSCFQLDKDRLMGRQTRSARKKLHGRGSNISLRFYKASTQAGGFKISKATLYYGLGNEDKRG